MLSNNFWSCCLASPIVLSFVLLIAPVAVAADLDAVNTADATDATDPTPIEAQPASTETLQQIEQYQQLGQVDPIERGAESDRALEQVTSVTQFSDVQPTDWAYQALQSLVERYGCIVGYPDGTYRGQSALTRYEFAAGLNACLDRISELIAASTADLATKEDLATLQRLQEEFAAELATLRGRVDSLEARVGELEENQFSTTTKLVGETIFAVAAPITEDDDEYSDQAIGGYRVRLNFDTSFTGEDRLRARLQASDFGNFEGFGGSAGATNWNFSTQSSSGGSNDIVLDELYYLFPITDSIRVQVALRGRDNKDWATSTISPFESEGTGSLIRFGRPPMYYYIAGGVGAGANVDIIPDTLTLDFSYSAANDQTADPTPGNGLFNGDYGIFTQLTFLSDFVDAGLVYGNSYVREGFFDDLGVDSGPEVANTYGGQVNFKFGSIEIGGGVAYVPIRALEAGDYDVWSYQGTFAVRDLGGEGNLLGVLAGIAPYASDVPVSLVTGSGSNQFNNLVVEGFYRFRLTDNISVQPSVIWLSAPENDNGIDDSVVGAVRTTFTF